ncbi:MAG: hypothetical protein ACE5JK_06415, partial [Candidatus Omnitrophota bacterium]
KNRHRTWLKIIAMVVVCLFTINTVSWAYPGGKLSAPKTTLQVPSIFSPLAHEGIEVSAEFQFELISAVRLFLAGKNFKAVNSYLTEAYRDSKGKGRKITFLKKPQINDNKNKITAQFKVKNNAGEDVTFEIEYTNTGPNNDIGAYQDVFQKDDVIIITKVGLLATRHELADKLINFANDEDFRARYNVINHGMDKTKLERAISLFGPLSGHQVLCIGEGVTIGPLIMLLNGARKVVIYDVDPNICSNWEKLISAFREDFRHLGIDLNSSITVKRRDVVKEGIAEGGFTRIVCTNLFNPASAGVNRQEFGHTLGLTDVRDIERIGAEIGRVLPHKDSVKIYYNIFNPDPSVDNESIIEEADRAFRKGFLSSGFTVSEETSVYTWRINEELQNSGEPAVILTLNPPAAKDTTSPAELWRGMPVKGVRSLLYPACGPDARTVISVLENLPHVEEIHLVDDNSQHSFDRIKGAFLLAAEKLGSHVDDTGECPTKDNPDILMLRFKSKKTSKVIKIYFHRYDYLKLERIKWLEAGSDLTIVKFPGYGATLTARLNNATFYRNVYDHTRRYILLTLTLPPEDKSLLENLEIIDCNVPQNPDGSVSRILFRGEYVVYRKKAKERGFPETESLVTTVARYKDAMAAVPVDNAREMNRIRASLELKTKFERDIVPPYYALMEGVINLADSSGEAVVIYPFMGPDIIPSIFRETISINNDERDIGRGKSILKRAFGKDIPLKISDKSTMGIIKGDALKIVNYEYLEDPDRKPCIFMMKGFLFIRDDPEAEKALLAYIFNNLREGDKVVALTANDVTLLKEAGVIKDTEPQILYSGGQIFTYENGGTRKTRALLMPDAVLLLEKKGDSFVQVNIPEVFTSSPAVESVEDEEDTDSFGDSTPGSTDLHVSGIPWIVGAAIGYYFGGVIGAAIGFILGVLVDHRSLILKYLNMLLNRQKSEIAPPKESEWRSLAHTVTFIRELLNTADGHDEEYYLRLFDPETFGHEMKKAFGDRQVTPARIDTYISNQATRKEQALVELIANAQDATLGEKPIGRFGVGAYQMFQELKSPEDSIVVTTSTDGKTGYKLTFKLIDGVLSYKTEVSTQDVEKGTRIKVNTSLSGEERKSRLDYIKHKL